jgi:hypothetical protein
MVARWKEAHRGTKSSPALTSLKAILTHRPAGPTTGGWGTGGVGGQPSRRTSVLGKVLVSSVTSYTGISDWPPNKSHMNRQP